MSSFNQVILLGRLGRDPEMRTTQSGGKIANFSLATSEHWRDKTSGERKERTEWNRIVVFDERLADVVEKYLHKGDQCMVTGQLQTRKWTDKSGQDRYSTEVVLQRFRGELVLLGGRDDAGGGKRPAEPRERQPSQAAPAQPQHSSSMDDLDDEIPF